MLLVSAELDEIMELSDRIGVMYRGRLVAVLDAATAEKDRVGLIMATGKSRCGMTGDDQPRRDRDERRPDHARRREARLDASSSSSIAILLGLLSGRC